MIREVEEAILDSLRKGISELVPPEDIIIGELDTKKTKSVSLINTGFTIEELGIGGSGSVKREEIIEKFDSNGEKKDYNLSQKPLQLVSVESPIGTEKKEPDDYTINYEQGIVSFRTPPEKGKDSIQVKYYIARAVGETRNLMFRLTYFLNIWADDPIEKNKITFESIKVLYRERTNLTNHGISEIRLIRGCSAETLDAKKISIIEYQIETTIQIEMPLPPIERIEIGKMGK